MHMLGQAQGPTQSLALIQVIAATNDVQFKIGNFTYETCGCLDD